MILESGMGNRLFYSLNFITSRPLLILKLYQREIELLQHRIAGLTQAQLREPALQEDPRTERGPFLAETMGSPSCLIPPSPGEKDEG